MESARLRAVCVTQDQRGSCLSVTPSAPPRVRCWADRAQKWGALPACGQHCIWEHSGRLPFTSLGFSQFPFCSFQPHGGVFLASLWPVSL